MADRELRTPCKGACRERSKGAARRGPQQHAPGPPDVRLWGPTCPLQSTFPADVPPVGGSRGTRLHVERPFTASEGGGDLQGKCGSIRCKTCRRGRDLERRSGAAKRQALRRRKS